MSPEAQSVFTVVTDVAIWTALLPLTVGTFVFRRSSFASRVIVAFVLVALLTDNVLDYFGESVRFVLYIPRIYTLWEFTALSIFFLAIAPRKQLKIIMIALFVPFICIVVFDFLTGGVEKRDDLPVGIESLIFIIYSLVTLYFILKDARYPNILARPEYWIISGILLYFGGNIFVFISSNYVASLSRDSYFLLWGLRGIVCVPFYSLLAIGLWKARESQ